MAQLPLPDVGVPIAGDYIDGEAKAGRMGARLMAIVAEGERGRVYLPPTQEMEAIAREAKPEWKPDAAMPENVRGIRAGRVYGLRRSATSSPPASSWR